MNWRDLVFGPECGQACRCWIKGFIACVAFILLIMAIIHTIKGL